MPMNAFCVQISELQRKLMQNSNFATIILTQHGRQCAMVSTLTLMLFPGVSGPEASCRIQDAEGSLDVKRSATISLGVRSKPARQGSQVIFTFGPCGVALVVMAEEDKTSGCKLFVNRIATDLRAHCSEMQLELRVREFCLADQRNFPMAKHQRRTPDRWEISDSLQCKTNLSSKEQKHFFLLKYRKTDCFSRSCYF